MMRGKINILIFLLITVLILGGCQTPAVNKTETSKSEGKQTLPNGDLQETTASIKELPSFLKDKNENMQIIYQAAAQHEDLLTWIPCYCGCGESAGHESNAHCFYKEIRKDGSIVWDDHGTRCGVCLEIAVHSIQKKKEGMTPLEIRNWIDETYRQGYAEPTPTPLPEA